MVGGCPSFNRRAAIYRKECPGKTIYETSLNRPSIEVFDPSEVKFDPKKKQKENSEAVRKSVEEKLERLSEGFSSLSELGGEGYDFNNYRVNAIIKDLDNALITLEGVRHDIEDAA